ncbi:hypothetical protein SK571_46130 [Lentzea sp. BCCO 10_0798]|uniref:Uncharacterized protein n=1 Tax=Lentzea kristufekii TaxID=3095430 RepID=A0ABU4U9R0_9PSEU|nr:hypothetical protein [Lentzea sp. BCCO 10_0798]MDX8056787.1 hypothetical protein [Lentzea sp. BCCO 10_0798]
MSGLVIALVIVLVVAARYGARETPRRVIAAQAVVVGSATFVTGLLAAGIVVATTP